MDAQTQPHEATVNVMKAMAEHAPNYGAFFEAANHNVEAIGRLYGVFFGGLVDINKAASEFWKKRIDHEVGALRSLESCSDTDTLFRVNTLSVEEFVGDCLEEWRKLMETWTTMAQEMTTPFQTAAEETRHAIEAGVEAADKPVQRRKRANDAAAPAAG